MPYDDNITQSERKTQEQVLKLISDLTYSLVDPRINFESADAS